MRVSQRLLGPATAVWASTAAYAAVAQADMTVAELLARVGDGKIGPAALINPRTRPALNALKSAGDAMKAAEARDKAAGRGPSFCPPKGASMGLPQLVADLRALPPAAQKQPVRTALPAVMRARFPCPARTAG